MENAAQLASLNESVQTSGGSLVVALAKDLAAKEGLLTALGMMKALLREVKTPFSGVATTASIPVLHTSVVPTLVVLD